MTRVSTFCVVSSGLAVFALSGDSARAGTLTIHTPTPTVSVHTPTPKVSVHTPTPRAQLHSFSMGTTNKQTLGNSNGAPNSDINTQAQVNVQTSQQNFTTTEQTFSNVMKRNQKTKVGIINNLK